MRQDKIVVYGKTEIHFTKYFDVILSVIYVFNFNQDGFKHQKSLMAGAHTFLLIVVINENMIYADFP